MYMCWCIHTTVVYYNSDSDAGTYLGKHKDTYVRATLRPLSFRIHMDLKNNLVKLLYILYR